MKDIFKLISHNINSYNHIVCTILLMNLCSILMEKSFICIIRWLSNIHLIYHNLVGLLYWIDQQNNLIDQLYQLNYKISIVQIKWNNLKDRQSNMLRQGF